jgi:hypothetical protein
VNNTARRPKITVSADGQGLVSQAGALLLAEAARVTGLGGALTAGLARWRAPRAVHDPGKIIADLAMALALGGDCLADIAVLRAQPALAGPVASGPVVSRLITALAADEPRALRAIRKARAAAREHAWGLAGDRPPGADRSLIPVDIDATIVIAHSEREKAAPTWKKTYGFHPLAAFADHGTGAGGEALAIVLRAGNAGSNTASEHIEVTRLVLAQLPRQARRRVLIRTDSGGGTHDFLAWLASPSRGLHYSVGMTITEEMQEAILAVPERVWEPACDAGGQARPGAWVAELAGLLDLASWPEGMRVIIRKERPHPGAQLRFTDLDGHRFTAYATRRPARPARRPGTAPPPPRPVRGPHPLRQRHRPAEPPAARLRPQPDLVRAGRDGQRTAGLDGDARPRRPRPRLGTQTAAAAPVLGRRTAGPRRPPPAAAPRRDLALGHPAHRRDHPAAGPRPRLTSRNRPCDQKGQPPGPVEPRLPGATAGQPGTATS